jgi:hypothetical protein
MQLKTSIFHSCAFLVLMAWAESCVWAHEGQMVHGPGFEGVIFTPAMMKEGGETAPSAYTGLWVPSPDVIRRAEQNLPKAIEHAMPASKTVGRYYIPRFYTPKGARPVAATGNERLETDVPDSIIDGNFLCDVFPDLAKYKRQYWGVTIKGKKYLLMSFIYALAIFDDLYLTKIWRSQWIEVLDGGDNFWDVMYDPSTGTFSEWECNGNA